MLEELSMGMSHDFEVAVEEEGHPGARGDGDFRRPQLCLTLPCRQNV